MKHADGQGGVHGGIVQRQVVDTTAHVCEAFLSEVILGLSEHGFGRVEEDNLTVAGV